MNHTPDFTNPPPANWPNPHSRLHDLLSLLDHLDLLNDATGTAIEQFDYSVVVPDARPRPAGGTAPPRARLDWDQAGDEFVARMLRDAIEGKDWDDTCEETRQICDILDAGTRESRIGVLAYLSRVKDQVDEIKRACIELEMMDRYSTLGGKELYALVGLHARLSKATIGAVLFQPIEQFTRKLLTWPTPDAALSNLQSLLELQTTPESPNETGSGVTNRTAAAVYLSRIQQVVTDIRIACVDLTLLKSTDDLDLDMINKLTLHLSTTAKQMPEEIVKWSLTQVARVLADTSHRDIRSCSPTMGEVAGTTDSRRKSKRSTVRGEGRAQLIAALSKHHKYDNGSVLNQEPIANNELARLAKVSRSTASEFFRVEFGGHTKYRRYCHGDNKKLVAALKLLNGEFSPQILYGATPPGEGERENDE